jgi:hypothetical protein
MRRRPFYRPNISGRSRRAAGTFGLFMALSTMTVSGSHACSNRVIARTDAPDGRLTATLFQRNCGATTGFSTQISILAPDEQPVGIGNTFRADTDHGTAHAGEWGGPWAEIEWISSSRLLVRYAAKARIFAQKDNVLGVRVGYDAIEQLDQ